MVATPLQQLRTDIAEGTRLFRAVGERLDSLVGEVEALDSRFDNIAAAIGRLERAERDRAVSVAEEGTVPMPDLAGLPQADAVLAVLKMFGRALHVDEIAAIVKALGYPFRTPNYRRSANTTLAQLTTEGKVERVSRGVYQAAATAPAEPQFRDEEAHLHQRALDRLESVDRKLPFVALTYYRDRILPEGIVNGEDELARRDLVENLLRFGLIETYKVDNPNNPDRQVTAIRLAEKGRGSMEQGMPSN